MVFISYIRNNFLIMLYNDVIIENGLKVRVEEIK